VSVALFWVLILFGTLAIIQVLPPFYLNFQGNETKAVILFFFVFMFVLGLNFRID